MGGGTDKKTTDKKKYQDHSIDIPLLCQLNYCLVATN